jgi:hypothetical protein
MRFNETCELVSKETVLDGEGVPHAATEAVEVFCNPQHVGANTWSSMYEIGISVDAKLQVRTCDYDGQRDVRYRGGWYSVEVVDERGDMTLLTLRHQKSDIDEADDPHWGGTSE